MSTNQRSQITMSDAEQAEFIEHTRAATIATIGPSGFPHLVAMWYGVVDGQVWFETKAKSQKVTNLRRDDRISFLAEAGTTYDQLRGVSMEGRGVVVDDPDTMWKVGISVFERNMGPYSEEMKPLVQGMLNKRVVVRIDVERVRTWDHRKLGMGAQALGGTTAAHLGD